VKELVRMWKYSMMVATTILCAGTYMLFLVPTKSIAIIPGVTEIRPASLLPVIFGLLFGPAGAWGSALGNLGGDLFGTLSLGSIFGFVGNFLYAYIPYKLWYHIKQRHGEDRAPTINSPWKLARFGITGFVSSAACAITIAWGLDLLNLASFSTLSIIITLNNTVTTLLLGPVVLPLLYAFAKKNKLLWTDIMHPKDISRPSTDKVHPLMIISGAIGGLVSGSVAGYLIAGQAIFGHQITTASTGNIAVALIVSPFLIILFYGSLNS
jgi:energy-coupling factor transport system substrate-specific component